MNLINLDIRMLRSLTSVVETGSITETARRLGRTQPAITLQLQRLEELTGKAIFTSLLNDLHHFKRGTAACIGRAA
jgi:molybdenum-dependent DNA-binding transcriptional regulator ModE